MPYLSHVLAQLPRLLSRMDREAPSLTYGACDRTFWSWKFSDFPGSRFQESLYAMAWLYTSADHGGELRGSEFILDWIMAGLRYWQTLQHQDGSFDEAYPFERSMAATAFTGFYIGEACLRLGDVLPTDLRRSVGESLGRAGEWLCANDEYHGVLSNHLAAAAAALMVIWKITGDSRYEARARYFLRRILSRQSAEGWYEEYGGADFGYQTHGSFYLARIWSLTSDKELLASLRRSVRFLAHFVHPNGTLGGEYGSRNTSFYFPAAFEILAPVCPEAAAIARFMRKSVAAQHAAGLAAVDAYNFCPMLNNYLFAHDAAGEIAEAPPLPFETQGQWDFPDAGLLVRCTESYYAVFAPSKGGIVKIFDKGSGRLAVSDCGYWAALDDGSRVSSQSFSLANRCSMEPDRATVSAAFARINQRVMNPWLFMAFRAFTLTIGRHASIAQKLKILLVKTLVSRRKTVPASIERTVEFSPKAVKIMDRVKAENGSLRQLFLGTKFSTIHMGSSRYFQMDDLNPQRIDASATFERNYTWTVE